MASEFELFPSGPQWAFRLRGDNNEILLASERYTSRGGAENGIQSCRLNAPIDARYERLLSKRGLPYFVLRGGNREVIGVSEEYSSTQAREIGIGAVKRVAPTALVRVVPA